VTEGPGPGVDAAGRPVIDPTENVKALNAAEAKRQDDLRRADARRQDDIRNAESRHIREILTIRTHHDEERRRVNEIHARELREAEADRLDALRAGDQAQIQRAAEVQEARATALATQQATVQESFRAELAAALNPINTAIADLRRSQYELAGSKAQTIESGTTGRQWIALAIAALALLSTFIIGSAGIIIALLLK
jgi:hypothetical protein